MENDKSLVFFLIALIAGSVLSAQEVPDPFAAVIEKDNEATSVLGGGWPPQNFGKRAGNLAVTDRLDGSKDVGLKIKDSMTTPLNLPVKKANPVLVAESAPKNLAPTPATNVLADLVPATTEVMTPVPPKKEIEKPAFVLPTLPDEKKNEPVTKQVGSTLIKTPAPAAEVDPILPSLPEIQDLVTPGIKVASSRLPRPESNRVPSLYTLGAGDTVTFAAFDRSDLTRTVRIAPDGTVSYLQAVAISAKGLTVDELRDRMESELQKYRRDFKLIISPEELGSKEFTILGRVQEPGTFPLTRPTTVLEGIALARGVEVGTIRGSAYGLADFCRSFVSRDGRKLDVDLSLLYHEGDLSQNAQLQPNDYIYVASLLRNEFFILGAVNAPGRVKMPDRITVTKAIAMSGGFQNEAYKMKVLVIRGDLEEPDVEIVNVRDVLSGSAQDIEVKAGDIIFVARRPFEILERVLDSAITTYVQTVTSEAINIQFR